MHTFRGTETLINFNSDLSGNVHIIRGVDSIEVPGEDLLEFAAEFVRQNKISQIQNQSVDELLGLKRW